MYKIGIIGDIPIGQLPDGTQVAGLRDADLTLVRTDDDLVPTVVMMVNMMAIRMNLGHRPVVLLVGFQADQSVMDRISDAYPALALACLPRGLDLSWVITKSNVARAAINRVLKGEKSE